MSCSADGTIRLFDIRGQYTHTRTTSFDKRSTSHNAPCVPQAMGGGKQNQHHDKVNESLLLDYKTRRIGEPVLYSVDIHPDGHHFIVGSSLGDVRLFDLRKIVDNNPQLSTVNIFRSQSPNCEITGCVFSHNGREIVCSHLCDHIYLYDTDGQYDPVKPEMEEEEDHEEQEIRIPVTQLQSLLRDDETDEEEDDPVEEEETEEVEPSQQGQSYKQVYKGHISRDTIKGVSFLGPNSEWIATGSDDARVYIWHKSTGKLATILEGHEDTVNTIVSHPTIPLFATGGIDSETKLWSMNGEVPTEEETEAKLKRMSKLQKRNRRPAAHAREMTFMLQILRHLVTQRQQNLM
jgi:WD40 repeat protein